MLIRTPRPWSIPERSVTPETAYLNRRAFLKAAGAVGAGALLGAPAWAAESPYPAPRNDRYKIDRAITPKEIAGRYNNFYEFTTVKERVHEMVDAFETRPWTIEVKGECRNPGTHDVDELVRRMPLEERVYRFRCVEAWAMVVPWTGFPLAELLKQADPTDDARYVRMVTFHRPEQAPGQKNQTWYPWPYFEALRIEEAMNELSLLVTGAYGRELPKQHGAPIRLIVPWKYGYKSIKSIVSIELVKKRPKTFWNVIAPDEYGFESNVDPHVPHPRWSQATERMIDTGERVPTLPYNGYGPFVRALYG